MPRRRALDTRATRARRGATASAAKPPRGGARDPASGGGAPVARSPGRGTQSPVRSCVVRPAGPDDVRALGALGAKLARAHHAWDPQRFFLPEEPVEDGYAWWLGKELENPRAVILAAVAARGRVVGYAYGRIEPRDWNALRDRCGV